MIKLLAFPALEAQNTPCLHGVQGFHCPAAVPRAFHWALLRLVLLTPPVFLWHPWEFGIKLSSTFWTDKLSFFSSLNSVVCCIVGAFTLSSHTQRYVTWSLRIKMLCVIRTTLYLLSHLTKFLLTEPLITNYVRELITMICVFISRQKSTATRKRFSEVFLNQMSLIVKAS